MTEAAPTVQMIPIEQINILNPRSRNKATFQDILSNISNVGLKKPITVARREQPADGKLYDLACGEGRLEAYIALGQTEIPAIVTEATKEDCFLMSLVENLARRPHSPLELMREINNLKIPRLQHHRNREEDRPCQELCHRHCASVGPRRRSAPRRG